MEKSEREQTQTIESMCEKLQRIRLEDRQVLEFGSDKYRLLNFIETPEMDWGQLALVEYEASNLDEIIDKLQKSSTEDKNKRKKIIDPNTYAKWEVSLLSPERIIVAALANIANRQDNEYDSHIACPLCHGLVQKDVLCFRCGKKGEIAKYPKVSMSRELHDTDNINIQLDIEAFVANGAIKVVDDAFEHASPKMGIEVVNRRLRFDMKNFFRERIKELGVDPDEVGIVTTNGSVESAPPNNIDIYARQAQWTKRWGKRPQTEVAEGSSSPDTILQSVQLDVARRFAIPPGREMSEWVLRDLNPFDELLDEFMYSLTRSGYSLGYCQESLQGDQRSPAFYLLGKSAEPITRLAIGNNIRTTLESAWIEYLAWQEKTRS